MPSETTERKAGVKGFARGVSRSLFGAAVLLALDVVFCGSSLFSTISCPIWILASVVRSAIHHPGWGLVLVRIGIPALTLGLVRVNSDFQLGVARENAQRVVVACERYHADQGKFPGKLEELMPDYLGSVPVAKYCLGPGKHFTYYHRLENPLLVWVVVPPYLRRIYNFETRTWRYLD